MLDNTEGLTEARQSELKEQIDKQWAEYDALMDQVEARQKADERVRRRQALEDAVDRGIADLPDTNPDGGDNPDKRSYGKIFSLYLKRGLSGLSQDDAAALQEQFATYQGTESAEQRALSLTNTEGGYLVPEDFQAELEKRMAYYDAGLYSGECSRVITTTNGAPLPWPTTDDTGKKGAQKAVNAAAAEDDPVFGTVQLSAYSRDSGMVRVPMELLQDSGINLDTELEMLLGERMGRGNAEILTTGTGANQPQGVINGSTQGVTITQSDLGDDKKFADKIIDLMHSVDPAYRMGPKVKWQMNDAIVGKVRKLKDSDGQYLWRTDRDDQMSGMPSRKIEGHKVIINQSMDSTTTANKKIILFGDFSKFIVRKVRARTLLRSSERYMESRQVAYLYWERFDSKVIQSHALKYLQAVA